MTRSPSTGAERMREYRRRRRNGVLSIRIRLATAYIDTLIERRYLKPEHRDDHDEIAIAVGDLIYDTLHNTQRAASLTSGDVVTGETRHRVTS
jgi:hypothetical protein